MKIYTGFGDKGDTRLFGGQVVTKDHPRIEVYGTLDELNSVLGIILSGLRDKEFSEILTRIQNDIFRISSILATPDDKNRQKIEQKVEPDDIHYLEQIIDKLDSGLPQLKNFILPGGSETASFLHLARTVCRRAERYLTTLMKNEKIDGEIAVYLNRLSDLLFVSARYINDIEHIKDIPWKK